MSKASGISGRWIILLALVSQFGGASIPPLRAESPPEALMRAVAENYAAIAYANYQDAATAARMLEASVTHFLEAPSQESLELARSTWRVTRVPYLQTETCRFYEGPIEAVEPWINSWPIDEHYVDYVAGDPNAGVINHPEQYPVISRDLIVSLNEQEGEKNISTGWHVIEFLLWGQDHSSTGPGDRSWKDYTPETPHSDRRATYLRESCSLLVDYIQQVANAWAPGKPDNYRATFVAQPETALGDILKGMGSLSGPELGGERMTVAYETKEQEDEHSCFSDNTHVDVIYDATGIQNVYLGHYLRTTGELLSGPGVHDLLAAVDPELANQLKAQMEETVAAARAIPVPFDQAILGRRDAPGRLAMKRTIDSLKKQADLIAKAAARMNIQLNL